MSRIPPLVLPTSGTLVRYLLDPVVPGGPAQVLADPTSAAALADPASGPTRDFPAVADLEHVAAAARAALAGNEGVLDRHDACGRTLNNLAAQRIVDAQPGDVLQTLTFAEAQFIEIVKITAAKSPRGLYALAAARFNMGVGDLRFGSRDEAQQMFDSARRTIGEVPAPSRDASYAVFSGALDAADASL